MKNLIYKELKLSIHRFFYILPLLLAALMFIPSWIYMLVFMYFFWISVPQIYGSYIAQGDYNFTSVLPIERKDIVTSKALAMFIVEGLHFGFAVIFGVIHNLIYGSFNIFFDINLAFFGVGFLLFGIFNIVFLPTYFRTAHFFGKPTIYATIATLLYGFVFEYGVIKYQFMRDIFEGSMNNQLIVFIVSVVFGVCLSLYAVKRAQHNFEKIDL